MKSWREECGVFGIWNHSESSRLTYLGLFALQHRGQESAGIVTLTGTTSEPVHLQHKGLGLVSDVFNEGTLDQLKGRAAVGHVRYSTTGQNLLTNAQPIVGNLTSGPVAIAHNGNFVNAKELRESLKQRGAIFHGSNDTECLLHLMAHENPGRFMEALKNSVTRLEGAFSLVILTQDSLIAVRDCHGFRPLVLGYKKNEDGGRSVVLASETCAFDLIGAEHVREIEPGEIFWVDAQGEHSMKYSAVHRKAQCVFEHVYFSRPDSVVFGRSVYESRKHLGARLAKESAVDADLIVPVPDSGVPAAIGYSQVSQIPFELGIIRNHYVGRTFIEPKQSIRSFGVRVKLNPQSALLKGKRVIVIDDSLVRGTTCQKIIGLVRQAGAKEVHLRIAAPPTVSPCHYGVDTPTFSELIANHKKIEEIRQFVDADSLAYLSMEGLFEAISGKRSEFCAACFDREYPTALFSHGAKLPRKDRSEELPV